MELGNGIGYGIILMVVAFLRELLGSGKIWGFEILGDPIEKTGLYAYGYVNNGFIILAPMALIIVGIVIWVQRHFNRKLIEK
jgi:Na+-transporting NADH:ubiquinone oxidoreductase subunit D